MWSKEFVALLVPPTHWCLKVTQINIYRGVPLTISLHLFNLPVCDKSHVLAEASPATNSCCCFVKMILF